jgi:3-isopropylmalate/(R)-2-methylmalate dehydratase large subunit
MAGIIGFIPEFLSKARGEVEAFTGKRAAAFVPDADAAYDDIVQLDVSGLPPLAAAPPSPNTVQEVSRLKGTRIDSGFIGSCTNGRTEDFEAAVEVLKGRRVKDGVMLKVVPATRRVYDEMLQRGLLEELFRSGAIIVNPGCGGCAEGHVGLTGKGEVQISTGNRNFPGKQGKGLTYLASPAVVAASCLGGRIAAPEDL